MKTALLFVILFSTIAMPALAALTDADLNQIRLVVQEEIEKQIKPLKNEVRLVVQEEVEKQINPLKADIKVVKTDNVTLRTDVAWVRGRIDTIDKYIAWLMLLVVVVVGIPQVIIAWCSGKDRLLEKQIEALTQKVEALERRQIVSP